MLALHPRVARAYPLNVIEDDPNLKFGDFFRNGVWTQRHLCRGSGGSPLSFPDVCVCSVVCGVAVRLGRRDSKF